MLTIGDLSIVLTFSCALLGFILTAYAIRYKASAAIRFCFGLMFYANTLFVIFKITDSTITKAMIAGNTFLYGPSIWWLVVTQITGEKGFFSWQHLVPAFFAFCLAFLLPITMRKHIVEVGAILFFFYMVVSSRILWKHRFSLSERHALTWLGGYVFLGFSFSIWTSLSYLQVVFDFTLVDVPTIRFFNALATQIVALALTWWAITRPELYLDAPRPSAHPHAPTEFDQEVYTKLEMLFIEQQVYTRPDLSLEAVADELAVTARELSNAVNRCSGGGFRTYLRRYRIDYAKSQLADKKQRSRSILDIAIESGFGNKSTFNIAFKAQEGTTPRDYRAAVN